MGVKALVDDVGRKMGRHEGDVEAADEEADTSSQ